MKKLLLALALLLSSSPAFAQCNGVFPNNTVCGNVTGANNTPRPTSPAAFFGAAGGTNGQIQYNNVGVLGGFTATGDCTINTSTGAVVCTKTNGVAFGPPATGTRSGNTSIYANTSGTLTNNHCVKIDANGNLVDSGGPCSSSTIITPEAYGAACDGVTHDEVAFQNALNAAIAANTFLQIPANVNCVLNANITDGTSLFENVLIQGAGQTSQITFLGNFGFAFNAEASYYIIQDFQLTCQSSSTTPCLKIYNASQSTAAGSIIQRVRISQSGVYGMYFQSLSETKILNNVIISTSTVGTAALFVDNTATADVGGNLISNNLIIVTAGATTYGIQLLNVGGSITSFNQMSGYGYDIRSDNNLTFGAATGMQIQNNQLDNFIVSGIWFHSTGSGGIIAHVSVSNNVLHASGPGNTAGIVFEEAPGSVKWILDLAVTGNTISTLNGNAGILLAGTTAASVTGNVIDDNGTPAGAAVQTTASMGACVLVGNVVVQYATHLSNAGSCTVAGNN